MQRISNRYNVTFFFLISKYMYPYFGLWWEHEKLCFSKDFLEFITRTTQQACPQYWHCFGALKSQPTQDTFFHFCFLGPCPHLSCILLYILHISTIWPHIFEDFLVVFCNCFHSSFLYCETCVGKFSSCLLTLIQAVFHVGDRFWA